jgi:DNA-binding transcriptional MocR family regulator
MNNSWILFHRDGSTHKYMALVSSIEAAISSGALQPGEKLPSNREISEASGVTVATVSRAMGVAARRGLVEARVGSGTFVCDLQNSETQVEISAADLSLNTLPTSVVGSLLDKAMAKLPSEILHESLFSYRSYEPSKMHSQLASAWLANQVGSFNARNIICTAGVHQGLLAAFKTLLRPGDSIVCESLTYTGIKRIAEFAGVRLIGAQCDEDGVIPESITEALQASGARVVVLAPTMHNPTTSTLSLARRESIAAILRAQNVMLIEDGVNVPLANDDISAITSLIPDRSIYLTGLSKCVASGFRLGYAVVPAAYMTAFHEALVSTQWIGPGVYNLLAESILADGTLAECIDLHRTEARARVHLARLAIPSIKDAKSAGYHVWVPCTTVSQADDLCARSMQAGVKVSPGSHFTVSNVGAPAGYRISLGTLSSRDELEIALRILSRVGDAPSTTFTTLI